jgi:hypothetical protein
MQVSQAHVLALERRIHEQASSLAPTDCNHFRSERESSIRQNNGAAFSRFKIEVIVSEMRPSSGTLRCKKYM